ncbi:MAG: Clp protease ClpP [Ruminococcus sp.]|nr:Clp protease ClpP [Ruminococcus sp.]
MAKKKALEAIKAYNILLNEEDDSAEVNLYGEVVTNRPTDWWTGEPLEGLYIALDDFLKDIDELKEKSSVVFHINSPGGEVFAGTAIYNRMKQFKGTVTTVVDGLAASAASIIAQGATAGHRKVCNGALTMIHGASAMLFGYYNAKDMKEKIRQISAVDKSMAEIYASCTGLEKDKVMAMLTATTWMTSQDAVDNNFADEIVDTDKQVDMYLNEDKSFLTVKGVSISVRGLFNLPDYIPVQDEVTAGSVPDVIDNKKEEDGGMKSMDLKELREKYPELYAQIRNEAATETKKELQAESEQAVKNEIDRIRAIDEIAGKIADKQLVENAKYGEKKMSAGDLALEALKNQRDVGQKYLDDLGKDTTDSGVGDVTPTPNQGSLSAEEQTAKDIADGAALIAGDEAKKEEKR